MAKNSKKTDAEVYREERKARLAKAAKKNSKKSHKVHVPKGAQIAISIVLVLAIVGGFVYKGYDTSATKQQKIVVMQANGDDVTKPEYMYYYRQAFLNVMNTSYQYDQYGSGYGVMYTGYDYKVTPDEQAYPYEDLEGYENPTWSDYFDYFAIESIKRVHAYAALATENGLALDEDDYADIEENLKTLETSAEKSNASVNSYLSGNYGKGVTKKFMKNLMEMQKLAEKYQDTKTQEFKDSYTDNEIEAKYTSNTTSYDAVSLRYFTISAKTESVETTGEDGTTSTSDQVTDATMAEAEKQANAFAAAVSDDKSFKKQAADFKEKAGADDAATYLTDDTLTLYDALSYETLSSTHYVNSEVLDWAFNHDTKAGATKVLTNDGSGYTVYMVSVPAAKDMGSASTYDVRHILVSFPEEKKEETTTTAETTTAETTTELETAESTAADGKTTTAATTAAETTTAATTAAETTATTAEETTTATANIDVTTLDITAYGTPIYLSVDADSATDRETYGKAQNILLKYLNGEHTEEAFAELANKYSEDYDKNNAESVTNGGIYEDVKDGQMVPAFNDWCFADGRQPGDVGIVESNYGYHIMYFVGINDNGKNWKYNILSDLSKEDFDNYSEELLADAKYAVTVVNQTAVDEVASDTVSVAKQYIYNIENSSR